MKYLLYIALFVSNLAFSGTMYKCKDSTGNIAFQDKPCHSDTATLEKKQVPIARRGSISDFSMWVEPNFVDTQYSALLDGQEVTKIGFDNRIHKYIPSGWMPYSVKTKVIDVYKGDLKKEDVIDIIVYISAMSKYQIKRIKGEFILSFCKAKSGMYYTSRNYLIKEPTLGNVGKFEQVKEYGTDYKGTGDCSGNYPSLNPDTHN